MWRQARNNRKIVRPTPAVPNTTCVIIRTLTAMTTTDISLSAQQVCSTLRARSRSTNSRNALRGTYVAAQIFPTHFYCGYSLATYSLATQSELFQNMATNTKFNIIFPPYLASSPLLFNYFSGLTDYKIYTIKIKY